MKQFYRGEAGYVWCHLKITPPDIYTHVQIEFHKAICSEQTDCILYFYDKNIFSWPLL